MATLPIHAIPPAAGLPKPTAPPLTPAPGPGRALPGPVRSQVEPVVGMDLGHVVVHDDLTSHLLAGLLGARAFTTGHHIWLGPDASANDRGLLAHESVHVAQQAGAGPTSARKAEPPPAVQRQEGAPPARSGHTNSRRRAVGCGRRPVERPHHLVGRAGQRAGDGTGQPTRQAGDPGQTPGPGRRADEARPRRPGGGPGTGRRRSAAPAAAGPQGKAAPAAGGPAAPGAAGAGPEAAPDTGGGDGSAATAAGPADADAQASGIAALGTGDIALIDTELAEHERWAGAKEHVGAAGSLERAEFAVEAAGGGVLSGFASGAAMGLGIGLIARAAKPIPGVGAVLGGLGAAKDLFHDRDWSGTAATIGKFGEGNDTYETLANSLAAVSEVITVVTNVLNLVNGVVGVLQIVVAGLLAGSVVLTVVTLGAASPAAVALGEAESILLEISEAISGVTMVLDGINSGLLQPCILLFRVMHTFTSQADPREVELQAQGIEASASAAAAAVGGRLGGEIAESVGQKGPPQEGEPPHSSPKADDPVPPATGEGPGVKFGEPAPGEAPVAHGPAPLEAPAVPGAMPGEAPMPGPLETPLAPTGPGVEERPTAPMPNPLETPLAPTGPGVEEHPTVPAPGTHETPSARNRTRRRGAADRAGPTAHSRDPGPRAEPSPHPAVPPPPMPGVENPVIPPSPKVPTIETPNYGPEASTAPAHSQAVEPSAVGPAGEITPPGTPPAAGPVGPEEGAVPFRKSGEAASARNEEPLTPEEFEYWKQKAVEKGMDPERIRQHPRETGHLGGNLDVLYIGPDIRPLPPEQRPAGLLNPANAALEGEAVLAHELYGHREAGMIGQSRPDNWHEEFQASTRAAILDPTLPPEQRQLLIQDAVARARFQEREGTIYVNLDRPPGAQPTSPGGPGEPVPTGPGGSSVIVSPDLTARPGSTPDAAASNPPFRQVTDTAGTPPPGPVTPPPEAAPAPPAVHAGDGPPGGGPPGGPPAGGGPPGGPEPLFTPGPEFDAEFNRAFEAGNYQLGPFVQVSQPHQPESLRLRLGAGQPGYWGAEPATGMTVQEYRFPSQRGMQPMDARGDPIPGPRGDVATQMRIHSPDPAAQAGSPSTQDWTVNFQQGNFRMLPDGTWFDTRFQPNPAGGPRIDVRPYRAGPAGGWVVEATGAPVVEPGDDRRVEPVGCQYACEPHPALRTRRPGGSAAGPRRTPSWWSAAGTARAGGRSPERSTGHTASKPPGLDWNTDTDRFPAHHVAAGPLRRPPPPGRRARPHPPRPRIPSSPRSPRSGPG